MVGPAVAAATLPSSPIPSRGRPLRRSDGCAASMYARDLAMRSALEERAERFAERELEAMYLAATAALHHLHERPDD